jgi:hypothetical protein
MHFAGVFHDPYERINVWSHGVPGILFLVLGCVVASPLLHFGPVSEQRMPTAS